MTIYKPAPTHAMYAIDVLNIEHLKSVEKFNKLYFISFEKFSEQTTLDEVRSFSVFVRRFICF